MLDRLRRRVRGHVVERTLGVVLLVTGVVMAAQPRRPLRGGAGQGHQPAGDLRRPDPRPGELQRGPEPARLAAPARRASPSASARRRRTPVATRVGVSIPGVTTPTLPELGPAPEFTQTQQWFNTPGGRPLTLAGLRGNVVLVDFWTYTCINCIRTLPFLKGLYATYHRYGLEIVGVETPEFTFEQEAGNVAAGDRLRRAALPGRPGQPVRHLERLPERVLAGRVPDRRPGPGPPHPVRRGRLQAGRGRGPRAALRGRRPPPAAADDRPRDHALHAGWPRPRPTSIPSAPRASPSRCRPACTPTPACSNPPLNEFGAARHLGRHAQSATAGLDRRHRSPAASRPPHVYLVMTSAGNRPARCGCCSTASRSRRRPAPTCTAAGDGPRPAPVLAGLAAQRRASTRSPSQIPPGVSAYDFTFGLAAEFARARDGQIVPACRRSLCTTPRPAAPAARGQVLRRVDVEQLRRASTRTRRGPSAATTSRSRSAASSAAAAQQRQRAGC